MREVMPYRGFGVLDDVRREFDSVLSRFFGNGEGLEREFKPAAWSPRVDVSETDKAILVKADLPGVAPNAIEVTVVDGSLAIRGEKREEKKEEKENVKRMERFVGSFYRSIPLPPDCDAENITAETANGVVTISIPKKPGAQPRKIAVKSAK